MASCTCQAITAEEQLDLESFSDIVTKDGCIVQAKFDSIVAEMEALQKEAECDCDKAAKILHSATASLEGNIVTVDMDNPKASFNGVAIRSNNAGANGTVVAASIDKLINDTRYFAVGKKNIGFAILFLSKCGIPLGAFLGAVLSASVNNTPGAGKWSRK